MELQISEEEYIEHCNNYDGICLECGEWKYGDVEPDAENYECDNCGANEVMGAENALIAGHLVPISEELNGENF